MAIGLSSVSVCIDCHYTLIAVYNISYSSQGFVILFACTDSNVMKYGLALIPCDPDTVPYSCDQLIDLNYTQRYQVIISVQSVCILSCIILYLIVD